MSQTSTFVKKLASNSRGTREAALESLKSYLSSRKSSQLSLLETEKLWKGLYYAMWYCDRPGPQEKLAESLGCLFSEVVPKNLHARFVEAFWVVMIKEWPSIDQWRIDKYYMLIRRVLRHSFKLLMNNKWDEQLVNDFVDTLQKLPLSGEKNVSVALPYHLCDIYLDELEFVIFEKLDEDEDDSSDEKDSEDGVSDTKREIIDQTPVDRLISPFSNLSTNAILKTIREKCKNEVLGDERLSKWGVDIADAEKAQKTEEDSDEEWHGFS